MKPYYSDRWVTIYNQNCLELLPELDKASAIVTDPPYELGFMGKSWDSKGVSFQKETWQAVRNVCKSGAMLLSFGGTRTFHRIACAIEDAGFEYRDTIMWVYGSGFPKSLNIGKAIDKVQGNVREDLGEHPNARQTLGTVQICKKNGSGRLTKGDSIWEGYGTALKPAYEPIIVAMNPLDGTFAQNALEHGVAGLNIDECRVGTDEQVTNHSRGSESAISKGKFGDSTAQETHQTSGQQLGRFPANFIHDGSQSVMELFPNTKSGATTRIRTTPHAGDNGKTMGIGWNGEITECGYGDNGSAARFFYCAKASKSERNKGCEELEDVDPHTTYAGDEWSREHMGNTPTNKREKVKNNHPTVKPLALMEYLVKLVKMPEYNLIIDPFMGSGTTLLACIRLEIPCIGIDNDEHTCEISAKRCSQEVMELGSETLLEG